MAKIVLGIAHLAHPDAQHPGQGLAELYRPRRGRATSSTRRATRPPTRSCCAAPTRRSRPELTPERFAARHDEAQAAVAAV